jgi:Predicted methyltransferase regulatory domain
MNTSTATGTACIFTDVVDALAPAKLDFATTAVPLDSVDPLNLTAEGMDFLEGIEHPIMREQARDYFVNQHFRRDLYVRGANRLSVAEHRQGMLNTRFVLMQAVCKRSLLGNKILVLASPVTGGGVPISRFQQLFLISIKQGKKHPAEWAQLAWGILCKRRCLARPRAFLLFLL